MNKTLSPQQLRLVVLLGVLVVIAGAWFVLRSASTSSNPITTPVHSTAAPTTPARTTTAPATPAPSKVQPSTPAAPAKIATHGLPLVVAKALQKHRIVVVSLYSPGSDLDKLAAAESKAAAVATGVGFVRLNVFYQKQGRPILRKLGVLDTPGVLVLRRPHTIYAHFQGFADRDVVEQAVADARR